MKTVFVKPQEVKREWYIIDATNRPLGEVAVKAAYLARGKHKGCYTPHQLIGDFVIVVNADKALMTGNKIQKKMYYQHSGYPGGMRSFTYEKLLQRRPDAPMRLAIKGMLPKGPLGNSMFRSVKIYSGDKHPHAAQQPTAYEW
ncbi:50S ribosomal protein L13 [Entomospira entomophila]|uniref:Large ribosomal subunit protein uL13 n=1 Tax=Entomospira entomophila TaxID=2719988 RepID=A0A968KSL4_9SPIO|nr:50S ribosomal protein L13 [Entomospira entomophilus]NIZ40457.1 50S ribosomal protein L13 [Entomospira entomophilus]WDI36015.1 50S ribosomal protein L13 [Entomospira entomophilus]